MTHELSCETFGSAKYDISYILLHDVLLMEARSFVMKYEAARNRRINGRKREIESEIDKIQNSLEDKDVERVEVLKTEHQGKTRMRCVTLPRTILRVKGQPSSSAHSARYCEARHNLKHCMSKSQAPMEKR